MPYFSEGEKVYKKTSMGGRELVGRSKKPKAYIKTLHAVKHGWEAPSKKKSKGY